MRGSVPLTVSARLQLARQEVGLTQVELAAKLGVHPMTVSRWERDHSALTFRHLELIGAVTGHTVAWFFNADGNETA